MYCPNCELRVETDFAKITDQEEVKRFRNLDSEDVRGDYSLDEVGNVVSVENDDGSETDWQIAARIDICANCAETIEGRTYLNHWDYE